MNDFLWKNKKSGWGEEQSEVDKHTKKDTEVPVSWQGSQKIKGFFGKKEEQRRGRLIFCGNTKNRSKQSLLRRGRGRRT